LIKHRRSSFVGLGYGVMDAAMVDASAYCLEKVPVAA